VSGHIANGVTIPNGAHIVIGQSESPWGELERQAVSTSNRTFELEYQNYFTADQIERLPHDFRIQTRGAGTMPYYIDRLILTLAEPTNNFEEVVFTFSPDQKAEYESWWLPGDSMLLEWVSGRGNGDNYSLKVTSKPGSTVFGASARGAQVVFPQNLPQGQYYISADFFAPVAENAGKELSVESILLNSVGGNANYRFPANANAENPIGQTGVWVTVGGETTQGFQEAIREIRFRYFGNEQNRNAEVFYLDNVVIRRIGDIEIDYWPDPEWDLTLPSIKDAYRDYFPIGNIMEPHDLDPTHSAYREHNEEMYLRHYDLVTHENRLKPSEVAPVDPSLPGNSYRFGPADIVTNWALENGVEVHGHTLVWHSQSAPWLNTGVAGNRATAKANMEEYIKTVAGYHIGKVVSWDVVNEAFF